MYERERGIQTLADRHLAILFARLPDSSHLHLVGSVEPRCGARHDLAVGSHIRLSCGDARGHRQPAVWSSRRAHVHSHRRIAVDARWVDSRSIATESYSDRKSTRLNSSHLGISYA